MEAPPPRSLVPPRATSLRLVRFEELPAQPWRNGGGVTRELLAWPRADDWSLRVSVADIARDGPFSAFPGVERWFAVLTGDGVRLGDPPVDVRSDGDALRFDGASAPACSLRGGPTRDLNLMLRQGRVVGAMARVDGALVWPPVVAAPRLRAVFTRDGAALTVGGRTLSLPPMSLAWSDDFAEDSWRCEAPRDASTWVIACGDAP